MKRHSIIDGLAVQGRVIGALLMRELYTRFGRDNLGFLWLVAEPIMFIGGVLFVRSLIQQSSDHGVPLIVVIATGYPPLVLWRNTMFRIVNCLRFNYGLLYHRQVLPFDIMIARILLEIFGVLLATILCYAFMVIFKIVDLPYDLGYFLLGWFFHIWFSFASALITGALSEMTSLVDKLIHIYTYLWLPIGGSFYMVGWLPYQIRDYAVALPSVSAYEIMRHGYFGPGIHTFYNIPNLTLCLLVMTLIGISLIKLSRRLMVLE